MAVTDYKIVKGANEKNLEQNVNDVLDLAAGWYPVGTHVVGPDKFLSQDMQIGAAVGSSELLGATPGTVTPELAVVVDADGDAEGFGNIGAETLVLGGVAVNPIIWKTVAATAALLDSAGTVTLQAASAVTDSYKIREIFLIGGGTNFGAGGDRLLKLHDGTTSWTLVPNANLETAPAVSLRWGTTAVPFTTGTLATASDPGEDIVFEYSGGTTDHTTGSISFAVCLEKVA